MGEVGVAKLVTQDIAGLISGERGFDVQHLADGLRGVDNVSHCAMASAPPVLFSRAWYWTKLIRIHSDINSKVRPALANCAAQALKRKRQVLFCITNNDIHAMPAHQFVNPQVFEVSPVREVNEAAGIGRVA